MADKSLFATNYRFEIKLFGPTFFNWRRRFADQVKADHENRLSSEALDEYRHAVDIVNLVEELDKNAAIRRARRLQKTLTTEMKNENKANMIVRKAALKHQLAEDYKRYEKELNDQGKALYFQRI